MVQHHWFAVSSSIVGAVGATLALTMATTSSAADTVAAVFPPWWTPASVMTAAASTGSVVDVGRFPSIVVVHDDRPGLASRLRAAGAVIIMDAGLAGGCRTVR